MKKSVLIIILLISTTLANAQFGCTCLPEGITFKYQYQIDNFQSDYPGCNKIIGDVLIGVAEDISDITNLDGLNVIKSVGGTLSIGGGFYHNQYLQSLNGLGNLTTIGGDLQIAQNWLVTNLSGLENLNSIGGDLSINSNYSLTSITALQNLDGTSIHDLYIHNNWILSGCEVEGICTYLASPNGIIEIYDNGPGCHDAPEIADACGIPFSCLPYGNYYFTDQSSVDDFQTDYPDCNDLQGNVYITDAYITNLTGLNTITSISGDFRVWWNNSALSNFTGLSNLDSVGGSIRISYNDSLTSMNGLEGLRYVGGSFHFWANHALTSLSGLDNLRYIGKDLEISGTASMTSLSGLGSLNFIAGDFEISDNEGLTSLSGIENLDSIGGNLYIGDLYYIGGNPSLLNLSGLDSLAKIGGSLTIDGCPALTNLSGLENLSFIGGGLGLADNPVLDNITGFERLSYVGGNLTLYYNETLTSLAGFDSLSSISGNAEITHNSELVTLSGLDNLNSLGGNLSVRMNESLNSLSGLESLTSINGNLYISDNSNLISLSGLGNLEPSSIADLEITSNPSLTHCEVQSICEYLATPNGTIQIGNNAPGCNSSQEVEVACETVGVDKSEVKGQRSKVLIYPNPASSKITVECGDEIIGGTVRIYDLQGQEVLSRQITQATTVFDISHLLPGMYFYHFTSHVSPLTSKGKLVKW